MIPRRSLAALAVLLLPAFPALAIEIQPVTSPGGITVWLSEDHSIPMLTLEGSFRGGAALDPEGKEGAATLMSALLDEGSGDLDASAFAEARESLATRISFDASRDDIAVSARMLTENRDASAELIATALTEPRFDPDAVERVRGQLLSKLRSDETDPRALVGRAFFDAAFPGHTYSRPTDGTIASVTALDTGDLRAAETATLTRDRLSLAVVGDITPAELGPLVDKIFGALPASGPDLPPVATPALAGGIEVIDLDVPQSVVAFGVPGIPRDDPDFIPAFMMDYILGGGGESRLNEEVREKRGLTYGINTYLAPNDFGSLYMGHFASANARVGEAIDIVRAEWTRMAEEGVTEAELDAAKRYVTGAYPLRFSGAENIAGQLLRIQVAGLGLDYVNRRNGLVEEVTVADVSRVARRLLRPDLLTFVVVGRPENVTASIND